MAVEDPGAGLSLPSGSEGLGGPPEDARSPEQLGAAQGARRFFTGGTLLG